MRTQRIPVEFGLQKFLEVRLATGQTAEDAAREQAIAIKRCPARRTRPSQTIGGRLFDGSDEDIRRSNPRPW
jgi:hypothetical protein